MATGDTLDDILADLSNQIETPKGDDYDYVRLPAGRYTMGLISIKNVTIHNQKFDTTSPGYHLVFRSKDESKAFVSSKITAKLGRRAKLPVYLKNMTDGKGLGENPTAEEAFTVLKGLFNKWYSVIIEQNTWMSPSGEKVLFSNVSNCSVFPKEGSDDWPTPIEFFSGISSPDMTKEIPATEEEIPF